MVSHFGKTNWLSRFFNWFNIKRISYISILLNSISIILSIVYLATTVYSIVWDICGVIFFCALFGNFILIHLNNLRLNKTIQIGKKLKKLGIIYLIYTIISIVGIELGNLAISVTYSNAIKDNFIAYFMIYFLYFGFLIFGIIIAYLNIKNFDNDEIWNPKREREIKSQIRDTGIKKILLQIIHDPHLFFKNICYLMLLFGLIFAYIVIMGPKGTIVNYVDVSQYALGFAFIFFSITLILLDLKDKKKNPKSYFIVAVFGLSISGICILPLCVSPYAINIAEENFSEGFGNNWRDKIDSGAESYFLHTQFSIPEYFLGILPKDCIVLEQILFYNITSGENKGVILYFDAYLPPNNGEGLPGQNSTLIRIHGGGWASGDKGLYNMMQVNKHFAGLGYVVFDIQYGLNDMGLEYAPMAPNYVRGNFSIDDMVSHIGIFTQFLTQHAEEYGSNLDSVFISGNSAGGQLASAAALGIASGNYTEIFGSNLTIKGLIPFYPAFFLFSEPYIPGYTRPEFLDPRLLVNEASPPCLIYHGSEDGLVSPIEAQSMKDAYDINGIGNCAVLWMPLGAHCSDIYFSGYYNQIFLYYMERFLYIYQ
ncbi:MAG: alpha/beta hydrolase [Promethearchaeota archaeon]